MAVYRGCAFWMLQLAVCVIALSATVLASHQDDDDDSNPRLLKRPHQCSSPGWRATPRDVSVSVGGYISYFCRSSVPHRHTVWLIDGDELNGDKVQLSRGNTSLRYGPVSIEDHGRSIGCEVKTTSYGDLPSPVGKITVLSRPGYSATITKTACIGIPFDFDLHYTGSTPPSNYRWEKNGRPFKGEASRVTVSHSGIIFTRVLPTDAGTYRVWASSGRSGSARASCILKVVSSGSVCAKSSTPATLPCKLALSVILDSLNSSHPLLDHPRYDDHAPSHYTAHVMRLIRLLRKPHEGSRNQGNARLKSEAILKELLKLIGLQREMELSDDDISRIADSANCRAYFRRLNCFTPSVLKYRTSDGTCNNFFFPLIGASGTPFARILPANYEDGISLPVGHAQQMSGNKFSPPWPSPRKISHEIIKDLRVPGDDGITHMFMQWGQFLDHDLDIAPIFEEEECGCNYTDKCIPVEVSDDDTVFGPRGPNKGECLPFTRSVPACGCRRRYGLLARNQINDLTAFIDASNVYGNTVDHARSLRLLRDGLLKQSERLDTDKGHLPLQDDTPDHTPVPFFVAGDPRANEQIALTVMHTIWMREHNRIARYLKRINPCWDDERVYQEARKIVGAQHQVITFSEFLPILFGDYLDTFVPRYKGYNPFIDVSIPNSFAAAAYRFGHSLVKDKLDRLDEEFKRLDVGALPLREAFFNPLAYYESGGTDALLRGLTVDRINPVDEFINSVLTSQLFAESDDKLGGDLATLNIQRGRDHGLPTYRAWEKHCKRLFPGHATSFKRADTRGKLLKLYGKEGYKDGIDLFVGGLAEKPLRGARIGPTFACIMGLTFSSVRDGDRFWHENLYTFTSRQRTEIKKASLAKVICTNADNIPKIQRSVLRAARGRQRVSCSAIPKINLWHWWDRSCSRRYDRRG